jgi:hypothetical protein
VIHGDDTSTEDRVASGNIAHFAVPLEPRESDIVVNLTIYVRDIPADTTLLSVADKYEDSLGSLDMIQILGRDDVTLPAGAATRFTSTVVRAAKTRDYLERRVAYLLVHAGRAYYFDFASADATADDHAAVFDDVARSVRFLEAGLTDPPP